MKYSLLNKKIFGIALIIVFLSIHLAAAQPFIGEDDAYTKNVNRGEKGNFYWIISKNETTDYAVSVQVEWVNDWSYEIDPVSFVLSESQPFKTVHLNISVPRFPATNAVTASVVFTYRDLYDNQKFNISKNIHINVIGFSSSSEVNSIFGRFANPLPSPLNNPFGALLLNLLVWVIIAGIIYLIIKVIISSVVKKTKTDLDDMIIDIIRKPVLALIIVYGVISSIIQLGIQVGISQTLYQIYLFIVLGIIIYVVYKIYIMVLEEITMRRGGKSSTFGRVLRPIFRLVGAVVIVVGGLIYALIIIGVEITAFLAGAGVFGLVIAFAAQETLSNFFSGIHILLDRPFRIGDIILLETGEYCRVENVGMRSTKLYSLFDHEFIILPNNSVANQRIVNIVLPDTKIRQKIEVGVAYGSDVKKVKQILYESAADHPNVLTDGEYEPLVRFIGFDDSSLKFLLIFTVDDVMNQWKTRSDIVTEIDTRFRNENVTIPFPQRTIWFNKDDKADQVRKESEKKDENKN